MCARWRSGVGFSHDRQHGPGDLPTFQRHKLSGRKHNPPQDSRRRAKQRGHSTYSRKSRMSPFPCRRRELERTERTGVRPVVGSKLLCRQGTAGVNTYYRPDPNRRQSSPIVVRTPIVRPQSSLVCAPQIAMPVANALSSTALSFTRTGENWGQAGSR